jgi:hypothetical protein
MAHTVIRKFNNSSLSSIRLCKHIKLRTDSMLPSSNVLCLSIVDQRIVRQCQAKQVWSSTATLFHVLYYILCLCNSNSFVLCKSTRYSNRHILISTFSHYSWICLDHKATLKYSIKADRRGVSAPTVLVTLLYYHSNVWEWLVLLCCL